MRPILAMVLPVLLAACQLALPGTGADTPNPVTGGDIAVTTLDAPVEGLAAAEIADADHYLPLHHACENGCEANVVAALLEAYPSSAYAMTRKQDSPLSLACSSNKSILSLRL